MRAPPLRATGAIVASAILFAVSAPPFAIAPLAVLAVAPLIAAVTSAPRRRAAVWRGGLASLLVTVSIFHWLPGTVHAFFGVPSFWSWVIFPIYAVVGQPQLIVWAVIRWQWRNRRGIGVMAASATAYTACDWLVPKLFHDSLGGVFASTTWIVQIVDIGGVYLLTWLALFTNELVFALADAWFHRRPTPQRAERTARGPFVRAAWLVAALWALVLGYGAIRRSQVTAAMASAPTVDVGVAQANIGNIEKEIALSGDLEGIVGTLRRYGELSDRLTATPTVPDFVMWPETAYPLAYGAHRSSTDDDIDAELAQYVRERKVPLLFGGYQRDGNVEFNSALLLTPDGTFAAYHKRILIPFGEYIPLLGRARFGTGGTPRVLTVKRRDGTPVVLAPIICYEALFTDHVARGVLDGGQLLVNLTNDSWFVSSSEKQMHLAMAQLRSIETRRTQIRATNTGISAMIAPNGDLVDPGPEDQPASLRYTAPLVALAPTPVMRWGNWPGLVSAIVTAILLVVPLLQRRRR